MTNLAPLVFLLLTFAPLSGEQGAAARPNELVTGKLVYVAPMPANLDQWILEFLRRWGKYKVTSDPEGVDLVIQAREPEKDSGYKLPEGIPQPRRKGGRPSSSRHEEYDPSVVAISVTDWVTRETL